MIQNTRVHRILFVDIETVSAHRVYPELSDEMKKHWSRKARFFIPSYDELEESDRQTKVEHKYLEKAAIYAEFSKIVCISMGVIKEVDGIMTLRLKSLFGHDEKSLLLNFTSILNKHYKNSKNSFFCGHNIREFDIPFICRRLLINKIPLPEVLQISGKKPWEIKYIIDTLELWKFGDYKHYISLDLMANLLNIPSPKESIDGSQVGQVYWEEDGLDKIVDYCERDIKTVVQIFLALSEKPLVEDEYVSYRTDEEE